MKDPITTPGKTYAVTSPNGCTVTTDDGLTLAEVEAGKQGYFVAVGGKVLLSDEAAVLTQLFKLAPQQRLAILGVLGGGVPAWFKTLETELTALLDGSKFELAWLAGKNTLVVHTDRISDELSDAVTALLERVVPQFIEVVRYNHNMEISWRDIDKYAECVTYADMVAVNPDFANDLTSDGEWCYNLPKLKYLNRYHEDSSKWHNGFWKSNKRIKKWSVELPAVTQAGSGFVNSTIEIFDGGFPALVCPTYLYNQSQIESQGKRIFWDAKKLRYYRGDLSKARMLNIAFDGCSSLTEFHATLDSLCIAEGVFNYCKLDKESALRVLTSLPDKEYVDSVYTNPNADRQKMTIGIHIDHQSDDEVLEAIASAEAKGWTLTVQWNGTPTAQASATYGLRKPPIYAKVSERESTDGTVERSFDWGHYVTDPTGYEEFRSVEAAREYFGLPDEDLTNN